ncbi:MAG: Hsp20/alpha crystallin family protein [Prevotellaceae bacterium]|nr:Hsp20/alpha crystallin family protein [Prevotellaceae bacterium]
MVSSDDFTVKIDDDNNLVISMEKKSEKKEGEKDGKYLRREFSHTQFRQTMILPDNIERDKIEAKVEHGVLNILISKKAEEEIKPAGRAIDVT